MSMARSTPAQKPRGLASRTRMKLPRKDANYTILAAFSPGRPRAHAFPHQQDRAACDRGIGDVESRPVPSPRVKIEKIHDRPDEDAIDHVADRTSEYQTQCQTKQRLARMFVQQPNHPDRCDDRDGDKQFTLPA